MIKAIIFDWGGVMSPQGSPHSFRRLLAASLGTGEDYARSLIRDHVVDLLMGKITEDQYWRLLEERHGRPIPLSKRNVWLTWDDLKPDPRMLTAVRDLRQRGYKLGLLSNTTPSFKPELENHHIPELFDAVVLSCDAHFAKPDPEIYELICQKLGAKPAECLFIDDQQRMLDPAAALGLRTILATGPNQTLGAIEQELIERP